MSVDIFNEQWVRVKDIKKYSVSNMGRVKNNITNKILKPGLGGVGYLTVALYADGKSKTYNVHQLVADGFLGPKPEGAIVNHKDGDKTNNKVSNLEWSTYRDNLYHAYENGLNHHPKMVKIVETGEVFDSQIECAKAIGGDAANVSYCLSGKLKSHKGLHFERIDEPLSEKPKKPSFLYDHQREAVNKMFTGCILNGGVGSGKSRTSLYYYFTKYGGEIEPKYVPMKNPPDLYIVTTAKKRNELDWEGEFGPFLITTNPEVAYYNHKVVVDSWQNIKKYSDVKNAFFILDEDKLTGKGAWAKAFLKIAKNNEWIVLSASPGDCWEDFETIFVANGFFKNRTEFRREHLVYSHYTDFPKVEGYRNETRLNRLRNKILIDMDFQRHTVPHHEDIWCTYDIPKYKDIFKNRWDPYKDQPIEQAAGLCYVLRRLVNEDVSRQVALLQLYEKHPRMIVFYSYDYELDILKNLYYGEDVTVAEYNGHQHDKVPDTEKWVYLVQYNACEGWNCIKTNTIVFYSQTYSYKVLIQALGRVDRLNTPYIDLYYYHLKSRSGIDLAISKALKEKKKFNERKFTGWDK